MRIELHIDACGMRDKLAEGERGCTQRMFPCTTIREAMAIGNAALFAAGLPMHRGRPFSLRDTERFFLTTSGPLIVQLLRREKA